MTTEIDYPDTLPKPLLGTLKNTAQEPWTDDNASVGSPRRRARYTRVLELFSFSASASEAERVALNAFYSDTLANGVLSFNWTHPLSGEIYEVRFGGRPAQQMVQGHRYVLTVVLEQI